jgi:hypothetical protein
MVPVAVNNSGQNDDAVQRISKLIDDLDFELSQLHKESFHIKVRAHELLDKKKIKIILEKMIFDNKNI